ncbi:MAG: hypothetical protein Q7T53_08580 [Deltaproteobacteria bacterium]|nr:hypothetical protein [Deltaproteobacteria bacterium]
MTGTRIIKRHLVGKLLVWLFIFTLPVAGIKGSLYLPGLLKVVDGLHNISLTFDHGEIHLVLSHSEENNNCKVEADREEHGHTLLDRTTYVLDADHHSNHEFHTDLCCWQRTEAVRTVGIPKIFSPIVISYMIPAPDKSFPATFISKPYLEVNTTLISHHTTVLLI